MGELGNNKSGKKRKNPKLLFTKIGDINKKKAASDKYLLLESQIQAKGNKIEDLEKKINDMGEKFASFEIQMTEDALENKNKFVDIIKLIEKKVYILEKTNAGSEFCEHCEAEFEDNTDLSVHIRDSLKLVLHQKLFGVC